MDRNNPVWREYLKAVIRLQIDAGADGIQLDEAELPITSFQYGGCFCKECMQGYRAYLKELPSSELPDELTGIDLDSFHYGDWLLKQGYDFKSNREETPLFSDYHRFQQRAITRYFGELADYARQYAASQGVNILVSGNFFNLFDHYYPLEPKVDLIITEMRNTRYYQPAWYRYVAGFAGGKPVIVVENPYGGVVPELVKQLKVGRGYDLFRMSLYEAAALGADMSVPYGAWMGSVIQDSFYPPHELCVEIQSFLAGHEDLYSSSTYSEVGVVYSVESNFQLAARRDLFADNRSNVSGSQVIPFWEVCEKLVANTQPYDVIFFPDGELRPDSLRIEDLRQYHTIILPGCHFLTPHQVNCLVEFLENGGDLLVLGKLGLNLPEKRQKALLAHPQVRVIDKFTEFELDQLAGAVQANLDHGDMLAINIQRVNQGAAIHIIRYDYDKGRDCVPELDELNLEIRLPVAFNDMEVYAPGQIPETSHEISGDIHHLTLRHLPLYSVVLLKD